ncbi:MAG: tail fiber domain-containing protein [Vicinamibacterales bacterium]
MSVVIRILAIAALAPLALAGSAAAQSLGTFRWQLQPYCNVITVVVTQVGSRYRVEGTDDRCGAAQTASVIGTAFLNPDGSVGLGLNIVSVPTGLAQPVAATISLATLSGTWNGTGQSGQFTFTPGAGSGGSPRPTPATAAAIPPNFIFGPQGHLTATGGLGSGTAPAIAGVMLAWNPARAAIRAGRIDSPIWSDTDLGIESAAFNLNTRATGKSSFAINEQTEAIGQNSFAAGLLTKAVGLRSVAIGVLTTAGGENSFAGGSNSSAAGVNAIAFGQSVSATGRASVAFGQNTVAGADYALVSGYFSQANGIGAVALGMRAIATAGSFVFADNAAPGSTFASFIPNQFLVRAANGVGFYTNAAATIGVELAPNGSQWAAVSDVNAKHLFRDLDGEDVLGKLARMPIQEWSYKAQDAAIRHVGPTAQDFKAAFGLGEYDLRIGTVDADGIALRAIQALEARTQSLQRENQELRERLAELDARLTAATGTRERR